MESELLTLDSIKVLIEQLTVNDKEKLYDEICSIWEYRHSYGSFNYVRANSLEDAYIKIARSEDFRRYYETQDGFNLNRYDSTEYFADEDIFTCILCDHVGDSSVEKTHLHKDVTDEDWLKVAKTGIRGLQKINFIR